MWQSEYPRLRALYELSEQLHPDNYFTKVFANHFAYDRDLTRLSFAPLENALELLDERAWKHLAEKARPLVTRKDARRGWTQLTNCMYEAFGYEWLARNGYTSIEFLCPSKDKCKRTPDLFGKSESSMAALEVKTINPSDRDIDRRAASPPPVLDLSQGPSDGFKNKLVSDIHEAMEQLDAFGETTCKIVLVVIGLDCEGWFNEKYAKAIEEIVSAHVTEKLKVTVHNLIR